MNAQRQIVFNAVERFLTLTEINTESGKTREISRIKCGREEAESVLKKWINDGTITFAELTRAQAVISFRFREGV